MQDDVTLGLTWSDADRLRRVEVCVGAVTSACSTCELLVACV